MLIILFRQREGIFYFPGKIYMSVFGQREFAMSTLEEMDRFFENRCDGYDQHMMDGVEGCAEGYRRMAKLLPQSAGTLLDLGCGTGLELDEIFKRQPDIRVTGVDLTQAMLDKLKQKHPDKNLTLINSDYFDYNFGVKQYDAAVSFQTMHHFSHEDKIKLYAKICGALKNGGCYIECDYMVTEQKEEDFYYSENKRLRREQNIPDGALYHYDTPCTIDNQIAMLKTVGFTQVKFEWRMGNTTILTARKG